MISAILFCTSPIKLSTLCLWYFARIYDREQHFLQQAQWSQGYINQVLEEYNYLVYRNIE